MRVAFPDPPARSWPSAPQPLSPYKPDRWTWISVIPCGLVVPPVQSPCGRIRSIESAPELWFSLKAQQRLKVMPTLEPLPFHGPYVLHFPLKVEFGLHDTH